MLKNIKALTDGTGNNEHIKPNIPDNKWNGNNNDKN